MMKDMLSSFCEAIYPDDYDRQDILFQDMMRATGDPIQHPTIKSFREAYERNGECPSIALEDMSRIVREYEKNNYALD